MHRISTLLVLILLSASTARAQDGFKSLFNGKDLTGWHNVNCAPSTWFVKDDMIITTGKPTGYLRTDRQYENFILEFEWFHAPKKVRDKEITRKSGELLVHEGNVGNSGLFVWGDPLPAVGTGYTRSIEVQVLVGLRSTVAKTGAAGYTSHGDLFSIHGARCKPDREHPLKWERCLPSENVCKGEYEWNHYRVTANNGVLKLAVNGKEVSGVSQSNPRKGYLALESEGSECRFKNIKIKELPSTNPKPEEICDGDVGFQCLFTGLDLTGWKASEAQKKHWKMNDGVLSFDGKGKAEKVLWSEKSYSDFEVVCDWRLAEPGECAIYVRGGRREIAFKDQKPGQWHRSVFRLQGNRMSLVIDKKLIGQTDSFRTENKSGPIGLVSEVPIQFRNVFIRELKRFN